MKSLNAEANSISVLIHEGMSMNNHGIGCYPNLKFIAIYYFIFVYQSGFHQINRIIYEK